MFVRQKDFGAMTFIEMEVRRSAAATPTRHCKYLKEIWKKYNYLYNCNMNILNMLFRCYKIVDMNNYVDAMKDSWIIS